MTKDSQIRWYSHLNGMDESRYPKGVFEARLLSGNEDVVSVLPQHQELEVIDRGMTSAEELSDLGNLSSSDSDDFYEPSKLPSSLYDLE
ncbi:hypothetical protein ILUMI_13270 [Ignelater luminosus]|uniref:Uncharacterized protein n=1 Tax=Ignelater luminosus TaxID=2038154 RepID=A0A8K0GC53_IGNLU|nr:hypothetical protein ILUMI_13270 [Ignelater luminosus]